MKTIGIKLADGSFYPVLKEGSPSERLLELTTAHNNQTKVMVDLYRSELGSMEDAEYVDSLQIEDLNEHPNGVPTLTFTVSIDENNKLSAKMVDNETGLQSNATITLVSRTLEERLLTDEYNIKDPTIEGVSLTNTEENSLFGTDEEDANKDDDVAAPESDQTIDFTFEPDLPDFNAPAPESPDTNATAVESEPEADVNVIDEFEAPVEETAIEDEPVIDDSFDVPSETTEDSSTEVTVDEPIDTQAEEAENEMTSNDLDNLREQLVAEPDAKDIADIPQEPSSDEFELPPMSDFNPLDEPILEDDALTIDEFQTEEAEEPADDTLPTMEDFSADDVPEESDSDLTISSEPLDFTFDIPEENSQNSTDEASPTFEETSALSGGFDMPDTTNSTSLDDLDLPDFDTNLDLDLPSESATETTDQASTDTSYLDDLDFDDLDTTATEQPAGKGLSFTGLYDKETAMGNSAANIEDDEHKNPKAAVTICILCAIICVLATLFVIMVIQPKFSLFGKSHKEETTSTEVTVTELPDLRPVDQAPAPEPEKPAEAEPIEPEPVPPVPQAQEEEVVIIENAEDVVPLPPPVTPVKPKDISYKIKWGDTLWDISDTYYKNPWRYKYIARYNGINNPDYIVSGTYINIPAE
ncbi:MAG: LysM peptidoglycan-binding domain-containing protein [Treponema sp.]|nr:LysM peptidoglycan-binding domain-containing protein [Treponema sp.]